MENDAASFVAISEDMASALRQLQMVDIEEAAAAEDDSSDEAHQLLRWLNNLPSIDMPMDEWLEAGTPEEAVANATSLSQLVKFFIRKLKRARKKRPDILSVEPMVEDGFYASAAMTQAVIDYTLPKLPETHPQAAALKAWLVTLPAQAAMRQAQSVKRLIETVTAGMERASGKNVSGKSAPERLAEISKRLDGAARTLRSVDSMEPPAREESLELAREILRRLKKLGFSDKPLKEMIDVARPEEKADFAQQIDEMVDMYTNVLQEAAEINSGLRKDQVVKEATDAIQTFAHGVKLMAAKEMPGSVAAAQQISADATHNPDEWGQLNNRTVGRLLKSMEGALEKAVGSIESEQEQQQHAEQQAQEAAQEAAQQADHTNRNKKKRKRRSHRSSGGKKQQKEKMAHEADDYVLKQGRFGRDAEVARTGSPVAMPGLTPEAMAAVRNLGGALLNAGKQAKDIGATLANVSAGDKILPDDKTITQRVIEEELRKGSKKQGPRV